MSREKYVLKYDNIPKQGNLHGVLSQLSIHNEKNISNLKLILSYRQFLEIRKGKGIKISQDDVSLFGDIYFRKFNLDTLITPDLANLTIKWKADSLSQEKEIQVKTGFPVKNLMVPINHFTADSVAVTAAFELSDTKYRQFVKTASVVNHYYGYGSLLKNIKSHRSEHSDMMPVISYLEVNRALVYIQKMNMKEVLNLNQYDPEKFQQLLKKVKRIEVRRQTLARQFVKKGSLNGQDSLFAKAMVNLSVYYLEQSRKFQPFMAASYKQMAQLVDDEKCFGYYQNLCAAIDKQDGAQAATAVFNQFVAQAGRYQQMGKYFGSLLMLDNAALWAKRMPVVESQTLFIDQLNSTIDGMLASYLKVAAAGFKNGNLKMGEGYLQDAEHLLNKETTKYPALKDKALLLFREELFNVVKAEMANKLYQPVIDLIFRFKEVGNGMIEDSLRWYQSEAYNGLLLQNIKAAQTAANNGYIDEAYGRLINLKSFMETNASFLHDDSTNIIQLERVSELLIEQLINRGRDEMKQGSDKKAMESYGKAFMLQQNFIVAPNPELDSLINNSAVIWLQNKIQQAELLVWAKKMPEAINLYSEIVSDQIYYHLENHKEINNSIIQLKQKMDNRKCVDARYAISNYLQVAQNRIKSKKWSEAAEVISAASLIVNQSKSCDLDTALLHKLNKTYGDVLSYVKKLKVLKNQMRAYGYQSVWKAYASLDSFYERNQLAKFDVEPPGFIELLKKRNNPEEVSSVVRWYLMEDNSTQVFRYLLLFKKMNWKKSKVKALQLEVARKMAVQISSGEFDKMVDTTDKWLQPLIKTYHAANQ